VEQVHENSTGLSTQAAPFMRRGIRIPMRDVVRLYVTLYPPAKSIEPTSVVVTITLYIAQTCHEHGAYIARHGGEVNTDIAVIEDGNG
jgi:predicted acyl esterase